MKLLSNCHTHTDCCDGRSPAADTVKSAEKLGFVSLGFSGHSPLPYESGYAMTDESLSRYNREIEELKQEYSGKIDILRGIEWDCDSDVIAVGDYDYCIGSVHQLHGNGKIYPIDSTAQTLTEAVNSIYGGNWLKMAEDYYRLVFECVTKPFVDVVGHIDLITKFNNNNALFDESDSQYTDLALACVDRILASRPDIVFEVNAGAMNRAGKLSPYPAAFILKLLAEKGARVTITSDCHSADSLDFAFDKAINACRDAGFKQVYILTKNGFVPVNIE